MASSGVKVPDECVNAFDTMKGKHKSRCIIYVVKNDKEFSIYKQFNKGNGDQKEEIDAIIAEMKSDPCLFGSCDSVKASLESRNPCVMLLDLNVQSEGKASNDVLLFMKVCPDDGIAVKKKMVFASSVNALKEKLRGVMKNIEISSIEDLTFEHILDAMK